MDACFKKQKINIFIYMVLLLLWAQMSLGNIPLLGEGTSASNTSDVFNIQAEVVPEEVSQNEAFYINVTISMPEKYKLYADRTTVTPLSNDLFIFGNVVKPEPLTETDPYIGKTRVYKVPVTLKVPVELAPNAPMGELSAFLTVSYQGCSETDCYMPQSKEVKASFRVVSGGTPKKKPPVSTTVSKQAYSGTAQKDNPFQQAAERFGIIGVILAAFLLGFTTSLTPCVYPMIPVTVSVIGSKAEGNLLRGFFLSLIYVTGLSLTYAVFGTAAALSGGLFGAVSGSPVTRIIVSLIFFIMALGMFDIFYIQMPTSVTSKLNTVSPGKGVFGVFLTGAVSGLIVGPCVGPLLVGLLVYIAALGSMVKGFVIMWSFAIGMSVLFLVIGTFSGAISTLPKAGTWMEKVKYFFGTVMMAAALYFIGPLIGDTIFGLGVAVILILAGVLFGAFDAIGMESTGTDRLWKAVGIFLLVLGAAFVFKYILPQAGMSSSARPAVSQLSWNYDEEAALSLGKSANKPVLIDFAADWCTSCKKIEKETLANPDVVRELNRFVLLKIDCTDAKKAEVVRLTKKYGVIGLPSIFFINSGGMLDKERRITEFVGPEAFLQVLRQIN